MTDKAIEVNGGNVVYEILGHTGDYIVLTPGGRFSKDIPGLRPLAQALVERRVPSAAVGPAELRERPTFSSTGRANPTCGPRRCTGCITELDIGPCILAGGSGGARDSMLTTMLYPELVTKLVVWNIVGGVYGTFVLGSYYIVPSILAVRGLGMEGVLSVPEWRERIEQNPANKQRFLDLDADEFLKVMLRWLNAFVSKPGQTIPGVDDEMFDNITGAHADHPRR